MNQRIQPSDLELAALISSKICHDVIGPVGAIYNGLEILDEDDDQEAKNYALDVIRNVTEQASARLQFARFAFGAAGSAGAMIDLGTAEQISRGFVGNGKHKLAWRGMPGYMGKDKVKLLLNLVASSITALPRGGDIEVAHGRNAREPELPPPLPRHRRASASIPDGLRRRQLAARTRCDDHPGLLYVAAGRYRRDADRDPEGSGRHSVVGEARLRTRFRPNLRRRTLQRGATLLPRCVPPCCARIR